MGVKNEESDVKIKLVFSKHVRGFVLVCLLLDARCGPDAGIQHALRSLAYHGATAGSKPYGQR